MKKRSNAKDVAQFMKARLDSTKYLYQEEIVAEIQRAYGETFVYANESGNLAIARNVLAEFRKLTPDAVWERGERCWRTRESYDEPEKRSQD